MSKRIRWGILGTGNIARQFSAGVMASRRSELVSVGSRAMDSATNFARVHKIRTAHDSYDAVLADQQVDAVYNSLPNSLHHVWTIAALKAGKHVLCEKPFAINVGQAQEMFDVAQQNGRVLIEAFMYRSHPLTHAVQQKVADGVIGQVKFLRSNFSYRTTKVAGNIRFDPALHGGSLMDVGCYCINFSRLFAGCEPNNIQAVAQLHETGVDEGVSATMGFPNGIQSTFYCGMAAQSDNTAMICGTEGYIEIPVPWKPPAPESVFVIARGTPPKMDGPATKVTALAPRETIRVRVDGDLYGIEADAFAESVLDGKPPWVTKADTLGNMAVLDKINQQIRR